MRKYATSEERAAQTKQIVDLFQKTLGISAATAGRLARVARNMNQDQLNMLAANRADNATCDRLAALGSMKYIDNVIALITSGTDCAEAISRIFLAKHEDKMATEKPPSKRGRQ